eukprot:1296937-Pleurochrysis_carterae.AAC.1
MRLARTFHTDYLTPRQPHQRHELSLERGVIWSSPLRASTLPRQCHDRNLSLYLNSVIGFYSARIHHLHVSEYTTITSGEVSHVMQRNLQTGLSQARSQLYTYTHTRMYSYCSTHVRSNADVSRSMRTWAPSHAQHETRLNEMQSTGLREMCSTEADAIFSVNHARLVRIRSQQA